MNSLSFYSSKNKITILSFFFLFFILEACIGGAGGLVKLGGGVTLRKINFSIALLISFFLIFHIKRIPKNIVYISIAFIISLIIPTIIGFINYGNNPKVAENFFMQLFFLLLPFYNLFIKNEDDVQIVVRILKFASLAIALIYLAVLALIATGITDFLSVYQIITTSTEFMGRGVSAFWFKGFLYLCLGLFFFDTEKNTFLKRIEQLIVLIAVYFTFTRGFIVALFVSIFLHQLLFKSFFKSILIVFLSVIIVGSFSQQYVNASFDREESDEVRIVQFQQVMAAVTPTSLIIGHGFGEGVAIRSHHLEVNYLEIFHKQGLLGLTFWIFILFYIGFLYLNCKRLGYEKEARPFFLATLFVYVQSATNPYLTNSIGLNMIMISIVSLNIYLKEGRKSI
ncbi:MAG: hypothetical protein WKF91_00665, partial [Segetibacter sp.]